MTTRQRNTASAHSRKVHRQEFAAKTLLRLASGIIIAILVVILGYILYKGFVSDMLVKDKVMSAGSDVVAFDQGPELSVIVNDGLRADAMTMEDLILLYNGRARNWGSVTEQDEDIVTYTYGKDNSLRDQFDEAVLRGAKYREGTLAVANEQDMIELVARTKGAVGYISADTAAGLTRDGVKVVPIRRLSVILNPDALKAQEGKRLTQLSEDQVRSLFRGEVANWQEVGGIDLPVTVIAMRGDTALGAQFRELVMDGSPVKADITARDQEELLTLLNETPGAVAFDYYEQVHSAAPKLAVDVEQREVGGNLSLHFILEAPKEGGTVGGISTIILNTVFMILLTLLIAVPVGVLAAVFLTEYSRQNFLMRVLHFGTDTLAGIPSIIFGLFGYIFFCEVLGLGIGLLSGTLTITLMILPTIVRTSVEAIKTVPMTYREGSLAVGATKWQTIRKVVLPASMPGVLTGIILGVGRAVGETAALVFTMGSSYDLAKSLTSSTRVLSVHLYYLIKEGLSFDRAFATATVLIIIVLLVNFATNRLIGRMNKMAT